ncbi:MAG: ruvB, partial [Clostridia bacterium]|nr:ruvB [Clostridia bacterium]
MSSDLQLEDHEIESNIRPLSLNEYIGQSAIKENIKIFIEATKK